MDGEVQRAESAPVDDQKPDGAAEINAAGEGGGGGDGEAITDAQKRRTEQYIFDDEKPKKKKKKRKSKPPPRPTKREYEATLIDLNTRLAQLRKKAVKLDALNLEHNKKLVEVHEFDKDVSEHLKRVQKKQQATLISEEKYNLEIIKKRKEFEQVTQGRIKVLHSQYSQTEKQFLGEIEMLSYKLRSLCTFSDGGDVMLEKMSNIENEYKQIERTFRDRLFAMQQRNVVMRNNTDKEAKARYDRIIDDFTLSREVRNAAYTRRLLSENSDLRRKYNRLIPINLKKENELKRLQDETAFVNETHTVVSDITKRLKTTQIKRNELLEKLYGSCDFYKVQIVTGSKYRRMFEAIKEYELKETTKYQDKQVLYEDIEVYSAALHDKYYILKYAENEYIFQRQQYGEFVDAVKDAIFSLSDLEEYSHLFPLTFDEYVAKRDGIIRGLIEIITNTERMPDSRKMLKAKYFKGYLGLMSLDYVFCRMLKENWCSNSEELKWVPGYCQHAYRFATKSKKEEKQDFESSDPALLCIKN